MERLLILLGILFALAAIGYAVTQRRVGAVWSGNSLVAGAYVAPSQSLPEQTHALLGPKYALIANTAVSGWSIKLLYENREEKIGQYLTWRNRLKYRQIPILLEEGINGIGAGDVSVAEYKELWTKLCAYIVARGGTPIILTNTPVGSVETYAPYYAKNTGGGTHTVEQMEAERQEIIAWQRSNWKDTLHALGLIDLSAVAGLGTIADTENQLFFQPDRVHLTAKGYEAEAAYCAPQLVQMLNNN